MLQVLLYVKIVQFLVFTKRVRLKFSKNDKMGNTKRMLFLDI